ncbi:MAG: hypothetical protein ACRDL0_20245, partial [Thermoleophilaceae bacterium]
LRLSVKVAGGKGKIAAAKTRLDRGGNRVAAELTSKGKRLLDDSERVKLKVKGTAKDAAGNTGRARTTVKLR